MTESRRALVAGIIAVLSIGVASMQPAGADTAKKKPAAATPERPAAPPQLPAASLQLKTETDLKLYSPGSAPAGLATVTREPTVPFLGLGVTQPLHFPAGK